MKWQYDSRRFTEDQVKLITDILLKIFCWRHMKVLHEHMTTQTWCFMPIYAYMQYFNYVMSVLLPEALTRVIADVHHVDFDEVWQCKLVPDIMMLRCIVQVNVSIVAID